MLCDVFAGTAGFKLPFKWRFLRVMAENLIDQNKNYLNTKTP